MRANGHDSMVRRSECLNPGRLLLLVILLCGIGLIGTAQGYAMESTSAPIPIAVLDLDYLDTSGEVRDQREEHQRRLRHFTDALRSDLVQSGKYRIVILECRPAPCSAAASELSELIAQARQAGAKMLLIGGIQKMSTLVQWVKVQTIDIEANRMVLDKLLTFRGDTHEAWQHAEAFVAREIIAIDIAQ